MVIFSTLDRWTSLWQHIAKPPSKRIYELYRFFISIVYNIFVYLITVCVRIHFLEAQLRRLDSVLCLHYEQSLLTLFRSEIVEQKEHASERENRLPRENTRRTFPRGRRLSYSRVIFALAHVFFKLDYPWAERETARSPHYLRYSVKRMTAGLKQRFPGDRE